jgi:hypothetical protein
LLRSDSIHARDREACKAYIETHRSGEGVSACHHTAVNAAVVKSVQLLQAAGLVTVRGTLVFSELVMQKI